jgi:hypothetical protein
MLGDAPKPEEGISADLPGGLAGSGVWYGSAQFPDAPSRQREFDVAVGASDSGRGMTWMVRFRSTDTGKSGSWRAEGKVDGRALILKPAEWVGKQQGWQRVRLQLSAEPDGGLTGTGQKGRYFGDVTLERIASGEITSDSLASDWRVAYALDEVQAISMLQQRLAAGLEVRDSLDYKWVPQVGSGCQGLPTSLGRLTSASILASHARLNSEVGAVTLTWDQIGTTTPDACPKETMWMAVVPRPFDSAAGAKSWCRSNGFTGGSCAARYLVPQGSKGTTIKYQ